MDSLGFCLGGNQKKKGLDLFKGNWLVWKEEDKVYFDMKWSSIEEAKRMPVRMELEASRDGEMKFQVELRLSPSPQKGVGFASSRGHQ